MKQIAAVLTVSVLVTAIFARCGINSTSAYTDINEYKIGNTPGNSLWGGKAVFDGEWIFCIHLNDIYKTKPDSNEIEPIMVVKAGKSDGKTSCLNIYEGCLYFKQSNSVKKMKTDCTDLTVVFTEDSAQIIFQVII